MEEFLGLGLLWLLCNYFGGTIRWIYGSIWRTLFNKPKFTYNEYVFGPEKSKDHFDVHGHSFNNLIITFVILGIVISVFSLIIN
jgi:hypothetical protein